MVMGNSRSRGIKAKGVERGAVEVTVSRWFLGGEIWQTPHIRSMQLQGERQHRVITVCQSVGMC